MSFKFKPNRVWTADFGKCERPSNGQDAANAARAMDAYNHKWERDPESNICDLIVDLCHLADREGQDAEKMLEQAEGHWRAER